jgi:hypothetical protein
VEDKESDEPPPLEKLAASLSPLKAINPFVHIEVHEYDNSVCISLLLKDKTTSKTVPHQVFRIYDSDKNNASERHVADNGEFITASMEDSEPYWRIREFLEYLKYRHFHNPYSNYIEKRFREKLSES